MPYKSFRKRIHDDCVKIKTLKRLSSSKCLLIPHIWIEDMDLTYETLLIMFYRPGEKTILIRKANIQEIKFEEERNEEISSPISQSN